MGQQRALAPGGGVITVDPNPFVTTQTSWSQTDWYVDPVSGKDANSGTDAAHPVQTIAGGIVSKWGTPSPVLTQTTTIHLLGAETLGQESIRLAPTMANGANFVIVGSLAAVGGTFHPAGVTAKARGTPGTLLQLTGMPAAATAGQLVFNVTKQSYAFIDSIAAGTATMTQPLNAAGLTTISTAFGTGPTEDDTWAASDTYQLNTVPLLNLVSLEVRGGQAKDNTQASPVAWVQSVYIPDPSGSPGSSIYWTRVSGQSFVYSMCRFDSVFSGANTTFDREQAANLCCWHNGGCSVSGWSLIGGASNTNGSFFLNGTYLETLSAIDADIIIHGNLIVKGGYSICGYAYIAAGSGSTIAGSQLRLEPYYFSAAQLWGPGGINCDGGGSIMNESGGTWATCLTLGSLALDGLATGTSYAGGVWTDGVTLTSAHLDANHGLQQPRTGSKFLGG